MIVAIMQPYFFPYIGYFQLMAAVDAFVFLDDVQYVEQRWMNRNRIRHGMQSAWLTLPVKRDHMHRRINEREYRFGDDDLDAVQRKLETAYRKASCWSETSPFVDEILSFSVPNVSIFNVNLLRAVAERLGVTCSAVTASGLMGSQGAIGQSRVLELCLRLGATRYINAIGGVDLYDEAAFAAAGVELRFLRTRVPPVALAGGPEHLSIIDGLMHDGVAGCAAALQSYELLTPAIAREFRSKAIGEGK